MQIIYVYVKNFTLHSIIFSISREINNYLQCQYNFKLINNFIYYNIANKVNNIIN